MLFVFSCVCFLFLSFSPPSSHMAWVYLSSFFSLQLYDMYALVTYLYLAGGGAFINIIIANLAASPMSCMAFITLKHTVKRVRRHKKTWACCTIGISHVPMLLFSLPKKSLEYTPIPNSVSYAFRTIG